MTGINGPHLPAAGIDAGTVVLRQWRAEDAPSLAQAVAVSQPQLAAWLAFAAKMPYTHDDAAAFIDLATQRWHAGHTYTYAITTPGGIVGCIHARRYAGEPEWSLGYWLDSRHTGHGYATAAVAALPAEVLKAGAKSVRIEHDQANPASGAVAARCGFVLERTGPSHRPVFGSRSGTELLWQYQPLAP